MSKRFLVLIDFSSYSKDLLLFAHNWSIGMNAKILLVHVPVILKPVLTDPAAEREIATIEIRESLTKLKDFNMETLGTTKNIDFLVSDESLLLLLPRLLDEGSHNLIFVGLKGTGTLKKIFWGSTTVDIVTYINHTVVAVPKAISNLVPHTLYISINMKVPLNTPHLDHLLYFMDSLVKRIVFISIIDKEEHSDEEEYLKTLVEKYNPKVSSSYRIFEGNSPFKEVKTLMSGKTDSVLVIQRGSRSFLDQLFRKFLVNELVYDGNTPLIVLPE